MNKKGKRSTQKTGIGEDLEIREVAYSKIPSNFMLAFLIFFVVIVLTSIMFMLSYLNKKEHMPVNIVQTEELTKNGNRVFISNYSGINENISKEKFKDDVYRVTRIGDIELKNVSGEKEEINYDVYLTITENPFKKNIYSDENSEVVVKFAYSSDGEKWTYISNAISLTETTLNPLMGNYFDISGIVDTVKVSTNAKLVAKAKRSNKIYWKAEIEFQNRFNKEMEGNFKADFIINYNENI